MMNRIKGLLDCEKIMAITKSGKSRFRQLNGGDYS
jgi:hypothetical protein